MNLCQTITDGGIYVPSKVESFWAYKNEKKPSFNKLFENIIQQKGKTFLPLGYLKKGEKRTFVPNYKKYFERIKKSQNIDFCMQKFSNICDNLAREHIRSFCEKYNVQDAFIYDVSHKAENCFTYASTINRGHYFLSNLKGEDIFKVRGHQQKKNTEQIPTALFEILRGKATNQDVSLKNLCSTQSTLLKKNDLNNLRKNKLVSSTTGLHDVYVSKKILSIKLDCGKFSTFENYRNVNNNYFDNYKIQFLYYCKNNQGHLVLDTKSFWKDYQKDLDNFCFLNKKKNFTQKMKKQLDAKIIESIPIDPSFENAISKRRPIENEELDLHSSLLEFEMTEEFSESLENDDEF